MKGRVINTNGRLNSEATTAISRAEKRPKNFLVRASPVATESAVARARVNQSKGSASSNLIAIDGMFCQIDDKAMEFLGLQEEDINDIMGKVLESV